MTRIFLGGQGEPIPELAMPDISLSVDLLPLWVPILEEGTFTPADYLAMGYTHFEAICIGAVGGRGGSGGTGVSWPEETVGGITHYHDPYIDTSLAWGNQYHGWGGGGGGGGRQKVTGRLDELPSTVPVVVGQPGADAPAGYLMQLTPYTPDPPAPWPRANAVYDPPVKTFYFPQAGGDGGASTFGGTLCQASGGKGGGPCASGIWAGTYGQDTPWTGYGGEGGIGGRTTPGGGAPGSTSTSSNTPSNGEDGDWDGAIGEGGGGGRGGMFVPKIINAGTGATLQEEQLRWSSSGGQGSFSFSDPSVFGPRGPRASLNIGPNLGTSRTVLPGAGGGAKANPSNIFGGRSPGAFPQGAVFVRLLKIV